MLITTASDVVNILTLVEEKSINKNRFVRVLGYTHILFREVSMGFSPQCFCHFTLSPAEYEASHFITITKVCYYHNF